MDDFDCDYDDGFDPDYDPYAGTGYEDGVGDEYFEEDEPPFNDEDDEDGDDDRFEDDEDFADPTGRSALRAASPRNPRNLPCPICKEPNRLTPRDRSLGYQCDECADRAESGW